MKKTLIISLAFGSLVFTTTAFAETNETNNTPTIDTSRAELYQERKEDREKNREIRKEERENTHELRKKTFEENEELRKTNTTEKREELRKKDDRQIKAGVERAQHAIKRLNKQISDLEKLSVRISKHLALRKSHGADTTAAEAKLVEAQTAIATTKTNVSTLNSSIKSALDAFNASPSTTNVNEVLKNLKPQLLETEKSVRLAQKAVRDVMKVRTPRPESSTNTTTP